MKVSEKISTAFIALFLFMPGLVKFTDQFSYNFATQIETVGLPFPKLSFFIGQSSEIIVGAIALLLLFFYNKIKPELADKLFYGMSIMVLPIMIVALFVHSDPNVPVEVLPFESRPPVLAVLLILASTLNLSVHNRKITLF
ncbi:hypothetical protein [Flammeovirga aprica]|uniref:DoxX family protein n=1 Tax=Flammeovirga aprica JL-4 TaxID=694437 RepID=A0A7X9XB83_9BACT|nr:hypothetical protein [Flammeovirga aprica]NME70466.1 hypothetical protein [Flammeovirga aprica JL-4]